MRSDKDVNLVSQDAVFAVSKATVCDCAIIVSKHSSLPGCAPAQTALVLTSLATGALLGHARREDARRDAAAKAQDDQEGGHQFAARCQNSTASLRLAVAAMHGEDQFEFLDGLLIRSPMHRCKIK